MSTLGIINQALDLDAATDTELLGAKGYGIGNASQINIRILNTGNNPVTGFTVYWAVVQNPGVDDWSPDLAMLLPGGALAAGDDVLFERPAKMQRIRLVAASVLGTSVQVQLEATT